MEIDVSNAPALNELVEVYEPSEGCWYQGRVVDVNSDGLRTVEYTQGHEHVMVETMPVWDSNAGSNYRNAGGKRVRPRPPSTSTENWQKGLWVDAHRDAWKEGILAEPPDGVYVCVYFHKQGLRERFSMDRVRVSQVWNEKTGGWTMRGYQPAEEWKFDVNGDGRMVKPPLTYQRKRKRGEAPNGRATQVDVKGTQVDGKGTQVDGKGTLDGNAKPTQLDAEGSDDRKKLKNGPETGTPALLGVKKEQAEAKPEPEVKKQQTEVKLEPEPEVKSEDAGNTDGKPYVVEVQENYFAPGLKPGINGSITRVDVTMTTPVKVELLPSPTVKTDVTIPVCHMNTQADEVMFDDGLRLAGSSVAFDVQKNALLRSRKAKKGTMVEFSPRARDDALKRMAIKNLEDAGWTKGIRERQREKNRVSKEAFYVDPDGKSYHSLTSACGAWMQQNSHVSKPIMDAMRSYQMQIVFRRRGGERPDGGAEDESATPRKRRLRTPRKLGQHEDDVLTPNSKGRPRMKALLQARGGTALGEENVKRATVTSWLIDHGIVKEEEMVTMVNHETQAVWKGLMVRDGVKCLCCNGVFTLERFGVHVGNPGVRVSARVFLGDGRSVMDCQKEALGKERDKVAAELATQEIILDESDECCGLCGEGGTLICCEHCPATFHLDCIFLKSLPEGDWFCPKCRCPVCGVSQYDGRSTRRCTQCERYYHMDCVNAEGFPEGKNWFCSHKCHNVFRGLRGLIGIPNPMNDGYTWTLLRNAEDDVEKEMDADSVAEHSSKLSLALSVMQECFSPMIDPRRKIDVIAHILKNCSSDLKRLDFRGFYTLLLEKDELISVAAIRVHGSNVAEMPLIGTRLNYRRQGMCRRLMDVIEQLLRTLEIETLVLPAVPELLDTWTSAFGFVKSTPYQTVRLLELSIVAFPGTKVLYKPLSWLNLCRKMAPPAAERPWAPGTQLQMGLIQPRAMRRPRSHRPHVSPAVPAVPPVDLTQVKQEPAAAATTAAEQPQSEDSLEDSKLVVAKTRSNRLVKPSVRVAEALASSFQKASPEEQSVLVDNTSELSFLKLGSSQIVMNHVVNHGATTGTSVALGSGSSGGLGTSTSVNARAVVLPGSSLAEGGNNGNGNGNKKCGNCGTRDTPMWRKVSQVAPPANEAAAAAFPSSLKTS